MSVLAQLEAALDAAQTELQAAEIASLEAAARSSKARDEAERLKAAVAAMKGEFRAEPAAPKGERAADDMSPEEFDKERRRKQRKREKELQENNPLAQFKCAGCGQKGTTVEQLIQAPSGAPIRMLACQSCGSQTLA